MKDGKDNKGRFTEGNKVAVGNKGGGRKSYNIEFKALTTFNEVFDEATFRATCIQLKAHIFGQKVDIKTGKIEDDLDSTPHSRLSAWEKMANYKLGKPIQPLVFTEDENKELLNLFNDMYVSIAKEKDDKLDDIVEQAKTFLEKEEKKKRKKNGQRSGYAVARGDSEAPAPDSDAGNNGQARDTVTEA